MRKLRKLEMMKFLLAAVFVCAATILSVMGSWADEQKLARGDCLSVVVWGERDLTQEVEVRQDGKIALPLVGELQASGHTASELEATLQKELKAYLRTPRVEVSVVSFATLPVYVLGQISRPGGYQVPRGSGVMELIAISGGLLPTADKEVSLLRDNRELFVVNVEDPVKAALSPDSPQLQPGDVLIVPFRRQADQIAVMGQVAKPGMYPYSPGMRVLDAIGLAGLASDADGAANCPDASHVTLTRAGQVDTIDLKSMLATGNLEDNLVLAPGDIITVPARARKKVYTFGAFNRPGVCYLDEEDGLLELVLASGGPGDKAALNKASLVRVVKGQPTTIAVDLDKLIKHGDMTQNIELQNNDILFLPGPQKKGLKLESIMPFMPYLLL